MKKVKEKIHEIINKILKKDKWKIYIYYHNQLIKKIYVEEQFEVVSETYMLKLKGCKRFFGTNRPITLCFRFKALKLTENELKRVHIEVKEWEGVE